MVCLIVDDEDVLQAHQLGHDPLQHLALGFESVEGLSSTALQQQPPAFGKFHTLTPLEGMKVGDDDSGPLQIGEHVARDQFTALVVAVGIVGLEHAQAILDRQTRCHDQEATGKTLALRVADGVDRLPGDQHRHDGGFSGTRRELQREAHQLRIGVMVGVGQVIQKTLPAAARMGGNLGQPDRGFGRLDLAEERPNAAETVVPPVL
ncbi:hypothetical protein BMS3Bbin12_02208 [bacterium BMS3Bbin12]|nr:hypothetical protein BMS3Bbin12_02208 [bacterium BMS3Bbin12]